jgi:UDP-N-acetylmuramoyl-L-alanyl-D-glutamate--2,6-diaminopimelate ligase
MLKGVTNDSRLVKHGWAFVAYEGVNEDLHKYIPEARQNGATLVVGEKGDVDEKVSDGRVAFAEMSAKFYEYPAKKLKLIGITGTNGKTSTAFMLTSILRAGYIGTVGFNFTTPDPSRLHLLLQKFLGEGKEYVVIETTSQGLEQKRLHGLDFEVGVFTNLTQDHLDYHKDMEAYFKSKLILFSQAKTAVLNRDDPYSKKIKHNKIVMYGPYEGALSMPGKFNQYNAGAAEAAAQVLGIRGSVIREALGEITVPGRFEMVGDRVIVDYAHTPNALELVLENAKEIVKGKLISVFGCGGDRDKGKRSLMGEISTRLADYTIITSDNPRTEKPETIIKDIKKGIGKGEYEVVEDRREAIKKAIEMSGANDLVVIAGKGHEDYQILGTKKIHFDDREEARKYLK